MAWETVAQIYREQGVPHGTTYWDIDTDTTELNDDFTKYITIQFNGQTLYVTKSAVYDFESYGGAIILVVKDTTNSGYIREKLVHSQSEYNYTTLLAPNYTENGLKVYIKSLSPEHLPNVQIPVTSNVGGTSMTTNISIFSDRITRVYTYQDYMALMQLPKVISNGGGATHIAKVTGQLKDLSSNLSDILMVSGGGGGGFLSGETEYTGKEAGGISGSGDNSADQSTGNAFGQGESGSDVSGGGSGLYGGYKGSEIQITPTPPSDYSYLENTKDFKWANTNTYAYESGYPLWYNAGWSNNPVSIENTSFVTGSSESYAEPENFGRNNITPYNPITADITDNGGTVTVAYSGNRLYWNPTGGQTYPANYVAYVSPSAISNNRLQADGYDWCRSDYANIRSLQTSFNSLSACCQYLYRYFRHININYNGTPWIYVGDSPETEYVGGGAGSGYIGNSLLSNKKMVGYNVPTSSAEGTKTESVNDVSASAVSGKPKSGNGFARIKYMANYKIFTFEELIKTDDLTHYKETWVGQYAIDDNWSTLSQWLDTDWNLASQNGYGTYQLTKNNDEYALGTTYQNSMSLYALPLNKKIKVKALIFDGKFSNSTSASGSQMHLRMGCTNNGVHSIVGALTVSQGDGYDYKVTDTNYHTFIKQFNSIETNYLEFYNGQYKDYFKNIKVIVEE